MKVLFPEIRLGGKGRSCRDFICGHIPLFSGEAEDGRESISEDNK
jgi:hypothetical protein